MTETPLKPCPFCGGANLTGPQFDDEWDVHVITCFACSAQNNAPTEAKAIAAWNTRTVDTEMLEALKPFAAMAAAYDPEDDGDDEQDAWAYNARPTIGQLRRARAAITKAEAGS